MAKPLKAGKQSVDLGAPDVRVSKIRREPKPVLKEIVVRDRDEDNRRMVMFGVILFALALFVITLGFASYSGWTPRQYTARL